MLNHLSQILCRQCGFYCGYCFSAACFSLFPKIPVFYHITALLATGESKTDAVTDGYLALRSAASYDAANEIGKLYTGDTVRIQGSFDGSYALVYSTKYDTVGWVNAGFLK